MTAVRVPSFSTPGRSYVVEVRARGLSCECPRAGFLKPGQACRHMEIVKLANGLQQKCAEAHGLSPEGRICQTCLVALLAKMAAKVRGEYVTKQAMKDKVAAARKRRSRKKKEG